MKTQIKDALTAKKTVLGFEVADLMGIIVMIIPVIISIVFRDIVPGKSLWFIPLKRGSSVDIQPDLIAMMFSAAFYVSLIVRYDIFKKDSLVEVIVSIVRTALNMWVIAAFVKIALQTGGDSQSGTWKTLMGNKAFVLLAFAIILSWLGMKSIAGYSWIFFILAAMENLLKVNASMRMKGALLVLFSVISLLLQISNYSVITEFKEDFRRNTGVYGERIKGDVNAAIYDTSRIAHGAAEWIQGKTSEHPDAAERQPPEKKVEIDLEALDLNKDGVIDDRDFMLLARKKDDDS